MSPAQPSPFGILLRQFRVEADLTQEELAERAHLSARAISDLERGVKHAPRLYTVRQLADALELDRQARSRFAAAARILSPPAPQPVRAPRTNLPDAPTSFVGRESDIASVVALLTQRRARLVTLTGTGGIGKTRLALRTAGELLGSFPDGVYLVPLAAVADPALVAGATVEALGLKEARGRQPLETISAHLAEKDMLLVLDNLEHLLDASPLVSALLDACPRLQILATSRTPLHLVREVEYGVEQLSFPDLSPVPSLDALARYDSVALFVERAQDARPTFALTEENAAAVAEICARLDGLPLALELAAARIKLFPPAVLLPHLSSRLELLTGGPRDGPARHQAMRATIDWSHDLLTGDEKTLFARLSVFSGRCTFAAADAVCSLDGRLNILDGLTSLVEKSLVQSSGDEEPRFLMLETVREYAAERLAERGEQDLMRRRHAEYFRDAVGSMHSSLSTHAAWIAWIVAEIGNLRAALDWSVESRQPEIGIHIFCWAFPAWGRQGHFSEVVRQGERLLAAPGPVDPVVRAKALRVTSDYVRLAGDAARAMPLAEEALRLAREAGDPALIAWCLTSLGPTTHLTGDYERTEALFEEALTLADQVGDKLCAAHARHLLAYSLCNRGRYDEARPLLERSLDYYRTAGDESGLSLILENVASLDRKEGNLDRAWDEILEGLTLAERVRRAIIPAYLLVAAGIAVESSEPELGAVLLGAYDSSAAASGRGKNEDDVTEEREIVEEGLAAMGEDAWNRARETGRRTSMEQAVELIREYAGARREKPAERERRRRNLRIVR